MTSFKIDQPGYSLQYTQNGTAAALAIAIAEVAAATTEATTEATNNTNNQGLLNGYSQIDNTLGQQTQQQQQFNPINMMFQFIMMMVQMLMGFLGINQNQQQQQKTTTNSNSNAAAAAAAAANGNGAAAAAAAAATGNDKKISDMSNDELQAYWNQHKDKESGDEIHKRAASGDNKKSDGSSISDPYEVTIDGEKYIFVKDDNKNGKVDAQNEILGINDSKDTLFKGMKDLDTNKDGKVDKAELDAARVKLAKIDANGKADLNQTKEVDSVDINSFQKNTVFNGLGEAGNFNVNLVDGKAVKGKEIFESLQQVLNYLFA